MSKAKLFLTLTALTSLGAASLLACGSSSDEKSGSGGSGVGGSATGGTGTGGTGTGGTGTGGASGSGGASGGSAGQGGAPANVECPKTGPKPVITKGPGALSGDETWTADNVYEVQGNYSTDAHVLSIEAGTVVCFATFGEPPKHGQLIVNAGGTLNVKGSASAHVVMTRDKDSTPNWDGIVYEGGVVNPGTVEWADFYWSGSPGGGSITTDVNKTGAKLDYRNVTFYQFQLSGIRNLIGGWTPETSITIHEYGTVEGEQKPPSYYTNRPVLTMRPETMHTILPTTLSIPDSAPDPVKYVNVDHAAGENLDESFEFPKLPSNLSYYVGTDMKLAGDTTAPNTWTIDPGARIAVGNGAQIQVGDGGSSLSHVVAVGTATDPIVFTSASMHTAAQAPAPGDWSTMVFFKDNFDPNGTKFEYVHFEYGGAVGAQTLNSCDSSAYGAYVGFDLGFGAAAPGFSIKNSVFEKSSGQAIRSNGNPPNLSTDYAQASLGNTFNGFTNPPAQYVGTCP